METSIKQLTQVEYELDIHADHESLAEKIDAQLRKRRPYVQMNGFRPGKVPLGLVKKLHGKAIAYEVVDELIQEIYRSEVIDSDDHDVLGHPTVTKLEYEPDGDLHALVQFGVRPKISLSDLTRTKIDRLSHEVTDKEVEDELEGIRVRQATFDEHDGPSAAEDFVVVNLQHLDPESGTPLVGERQEDVTFFLGAEELDEEAKTALTGVNIGDTVRFSVAAPDSDDRNRYEATVIRIRTRTLPELDDEFAKTATGDKIETMDALRDDVTSQLRGQWDRVLKEKFEEALTKAVVEANEIDVPPSVVNIYLDSLIEEAKKRNQGSLPEGFDVEHFRQHNLADAERATRWMLIKDQIMADQEISVGDDDLEESFSEMGSGGEGETGASVRKMFEEHYPEMIGQMQRRIENQRVFDWLIEQVEIVDKEWEDDRP